MLPIPPANWLWKSLAFNLLLAAVGFGATPEGAQLYVMQRDGTALRPWTQEPTATFGAPAWSHDGKWFAYTRLLSPNANTAPELAKPPTPHVWIAQVDGSHSQDLGPGDLPDWSLDDQQLAIQTESHLGLQIELLAPSQGENRALLASAARGPRWSPDGRYLGYTDLAQRNLTILDVVTGERRFALSAGWDPDVGFAWSPDGSHIAFRLAGYRDEPDALILANTRQPQTRTRYKGQFLGRMAWSPDGKSILLSQRRDERSPYQLVLLPVAGTSDTAPIPGQPAARNNTSMAWSPDGSQIVFASAPFQP